MPIEFRECDATVWLSEEFSVDAERIAFRGSWVEFITVSGNRRVYPSDSIDHVSIHKGYDS